MSIGSIGVKMNQTSIWKLKMVWFWVMEENGFLEIKLKQLTSFVGLFMNDIKLP